MPPQERDSSGATQSFVKLPRSVTHNGKLCRPSTAPSSTSPYDMPLPPPRLGVVQQKAESQIFRGDPLSRAFSRLCSLGTDTRKLRETIPPVHNQGDSTGKKLSLRRRSRRSSSSSFLTQTYSSQHATTSTARLVIPQPSLPMADITAKSPTINSSIIPDGNDREESSDETSVNRQKEVQLQMARLAKLRRHLGEDIPPEMVLSPTLHVDTTRSMDPAEIASHLKEAREGQRSLDPTAYVLSAPVPQNSRLRKSRSLHDRKRISKMETNTHDDHAVQKKNPFELRIPQTEVELSKPREHAPVPIPHSVQCPLHPSCLPTSLASRAAERLQICDNLVAADLVSVDKPSNSEDGEGRSAVDPRSRSLHSAKGVESHPSLSAHTPSYPEPEVSVKVRRRTRFWRRTNVIQSVHPDDITKQLRVMKAST